MASPRISPQASKPRLLVTMIAPRFVVARDQSEEQVGGLALQREVADLVDDEQAVALQAPQLGVERVAVLGLLEAVDPLLAGRRGSGVLLDARVRQLRDE